MGILGWGSRALTPPRWRWPSVAGAPGECSFLKSPDDLRAPPHPCPRPPVWHKLSRWQSGLPAPRAFLSFSDQVVGCLLLAQKPRTGAAKAAGLARRRDAELGSWALKLCAHCPFCFIFSWHLHPAESGGCAREGRSSQGRGQQVGVGTRAPSSRHSGAVFLFRGRRGPARWEKGDSLGEAPLTSPWWACTAVSWGLRGQSWPLCSASPPDDWASWQKMPGGISGNGSDTQHNRM